LREYFNINSAEVGKRILYSIIPFNPKFHDISEKNPDLYGPFWIYTTLIFVIAAAGSFSSFLDGKSSKNYFQVFVPISAGIVILYFLNRFME
jgi:hypothetical protein